ncbi:MAG: hypothetical protein PHS18_03370, partial [Sphaerochaetaceae bacterium]|jgi:hypothetical protein|nr:hypothetical protein [Sphaerochaetaceae bacterium]
MHQHITNEFLAIGCLTFQIMICLQLSYAKYISPYPGTKMIQIAPEDVLMALGVVLEHTFSYGQIAYRQTAFHTQ